MHDFKWWVSATAILMGVTALAGCGDDEPVEPARYAGDGEDR